MLDLPTLLQHVVSLIDFSSENNLKLIAMLKKYGENSYTNTNSGKLNSAMNSVLDFGSYTTVLTNILHTCLKYTCLKDAKIRFTSHYRTISSTEFENKAITLNDLIKPDIYIPDIHPYSYVHIVYVPKGKTYLKEILDTPENASKRIKSAENVLIKSIHHYVRVYKEFIPENQNANIIVFTDTIDSNFVANVILQAPKLLGVFDTETPITKALLNIYSYLYEITHTTNTTTLADAKKRINELVNDLINVVEEDFDDTKIFLNSLVNHTKQSALTRAINMAQATQNTIKRLHNDLEEYYTELQEANLLINSLQNNNDTDFTEIIDFIKHSKAIQILNSTETDLTLCVTAPLQYYIAQDFITYEANPHSDYNRYLRNNDNNIAAALKKIYHSIIVDRKYKLLMEAEINIHLKLDTGTININAEKYSQHLTNCPNPHLNFFNCWDRAKEEIQKHINANNYILMFQQIVAAVQTVNMAENLTFVGHTLSDLCDLARCKNYSVIDKENNVLTIQQLLEKELEKNETNQD